MLRPRTIFLAFAAALLCSLLLAPTQSQWTSRRITNTAEEGVSINPSISGDGRIIGFESTEDIAGSGGTNYFRAIRANISVDPPTFFQTGKTRAVAPGISQDGSRIAFASKDDPLGTNADGNSEIFVFNGSNLLQITNTTPSSPANRVTEGNFQPSISDDGRFVAFSSNRNLMLQNGDGNLEVFVFDSAATSFTQLTNSRGIVGFSDAKISGDGTAIACVRDTSATTSTNRDLLKITRTNAAQTVLSLNVARLAMTYGRAISDDGTRVTYSSETAANSTQVFFYDGRTGDVNRQVTTLGTRTTEVPLHPTISGDGRRIAFAARRALTGFSNSDASVELYTYDIPTGTFARITNATSGDADCFDGSNAACEVVSSLSDDGSTVVFNFPRGLSGTVTSGLENKSEIYATGLVARPPFGTLTSILNQASLGHEPSPIKAVAPNSIAAAFGSVLANTTQQSQKLPNETFPTNVAGTTVTVNGRAAQIFFVSPERVHFLVPAQTEIGNAEVVITNADGFASRGSVLILLAAPGIFTKTGDGIGEGMILNADTLAEGPFDPSSGNLRLLIFSTGVRNGLTRTVNIGGRVVMPEAVNQSTEMPGLDEVLVRVPADLRGAGNVNLFIQADGRDSNPLTVKFLGDPTRNVVINEVMADPADGIAGDANHDGVRDGTDDEFVELVNGTSSEVISLGGWTIRTRATGSTTENTHFTFVSGTSLPAGEAIVVFGGGDFDPSDTVFGCAQVVKATTTAGLSLTNSGVTILIRDASGNLISEFSYGGSTGRDGNNNQSLTRSPDVTGAYAQHTAAGDANGRRFSPGLRTDGTPFGNCPSILTSVTISPPSATIDVGQTQQFMAPAFDQFGRAMTGVAITFTSDNTNVATVDSVTMNSTIGVAAADVRGRNPGVANIRASATDGMNTVNSTPAVLTVTGPALTINDVSQSEGNAGTSTFTFTVSLSTTAAAPVTFDIATQDNTATAVSGDYVTRSLTSQTIAAGQQTNTFDVTVNGDAVMEPTETFFVNVSNVSGASVTDAQGVGTIVADDIPLLSVNDVTKEEGNTGATTFTFTVSSNLPAPAEGITFDIATQDNSATVANNDYVARSLTSQSIPSGQFSYTFDVSVNGDTTVEPDEAFFVNISNVSANSGVADGQGVGTIQNDDASDLVISQVYGGGNNSGAPFRNDFVEIYNRGTTTVDFAVTPYSIQYTGVGANFSSGNQTNLTNGSIAPGKYFLVQEGGGTTNGVALPAPDATGSIAMGSTAGKVALVIGTTTLPASTCPGDDSVTPFNPSNVSIADFVGYGNSASTSGHCYEGAAPAAAPSNTAADFRKAGGCVDTNDSGADFFAASPKPRNSSSPAGNCQPEITINDVAVNETNSGTVNVTFTVSLSAASSETVTVNFATADGTATLAGNDYLSNSGMVTFGPGDLTKTITVLVNGDTLDEANETYFVNLSGATNAMVLDAQAQGTINDNDPTPSLSINDLSIAEGDSGTTAFTFTVTLSAASGQTITVNFATSDNTATSASDYQSHSDSLTFVPGDTEESITVLVNGDASFEPNETFFVNLSGATNASISDAQGLGTITNDDAAPPTPTFFITNPNVTEGNAGTVNAVFDVSLSPASAVIVQVDYATVDGSATSAGNDYQPTSGKLIFNPGDGTKQITVLVNGDTLVEPNETFIVHLSNATNGAGIGTPDGTGTIQNDDAADLVISQTYPGGGLTRATFTHDFIELFNQGTTTVNLAVTPYSVQFLSTTASTWSKTDLTSGTIAPGGYFLIQETSGGANGVTLPRPDKTGSLNLTSTTAGKVALVVGTTLLTGNCPGDNGSAPFNPVNSTVVDFVGYGGTSATANHCYEGLGPAPFTSSNNTIAEFRKFGGCQDTNVNAVDFATATPNPRNTSAPINDCTAADLKITKTDSLDPVIVGSNVTYTITVSNLGPATANSVVVTENLPANVSFVSCLSTGTGVCGGTGNNRTVTFASLAAGATEIITLVARANGPPGTAISNTAKVSTSTTDPVLENNSATATTDVISPNFADLLITKSDSIDPVAPGNTLTYTTGLTNNGPDTAQSVVVTDNLPADVTFVDCSSNQGGVCGGAATSPTVTFSSLANGVTATITIRVTLSNALTTGAVITNTASVAAGSVDSNSGNDSDTETTNVQEASAGDILISEFRFRGSAGANDEFIELYNPTSRTIDISGFKIFRSNNAAVTTQHVTINSGVLLPSGCHYLLTNANASGPYNDSVPGNQTYSTGTADDGGLAVTLASGTASSRILDQLGLSAGSAYKEGTPLASLGATNDDRTYERKQGGSFGNGTDTNDNSADFLLNASNVSNPQNLSTGCINTSVSDLSITKTDSPDPVIVGSNVTYTITVTNHGPATGPSVVVTDNLPANLTFVSCVSTGTGVCGGRSNNRTVTYTSIAPGSSETITLIASANGPAGTQISNTATVASSTTDPNAANDSATATTDVNNPTFADLSISKTDSPDPVFPAQTLTYALTVTNKGPDVAQSVVVTDSLPSEVTLIDCASDQGGVCAGTAASPTVRFTSLANGVTATITMNVTVNSNMTAGTLITNNASVTSATSDSNGANNSNSENTTVQEVSAGQLVISEFRTRGPAGASDEFVEIYNPTTTTLVIGGLRIRASNNAGSISDRVTITAGTALGPGCYYLVANSSASGYSGAIAPNQTYTTGITDDGGIAINRANGTTIIDQVGMSAGSAYKEGTTLTPLVASPNEPSYERKPGGSFGNGTDTNDNAADFIHNASSSNPQNSSSGCLNTSSADLSITKTDSPDPVTIGSNITYTLTILNNGATTAQNVLVTDNLPSEVTFVSCTPTGGAACGGSGNNRSVTVSSLASGASFTATIVATANGPHGTTASNTATVSATTTDANSSNNSATAITLMQEPTPSLSINDVTLSEGNSGPATFAFTVTLSPASRQPVTVNYATADNTATAPSDYTGIPATQLTFDPGDTMKTVNVTVSGDTTVEPDESFNVNLSGATNAIISDSQGVGTITNDDGATVVISQVYTGGGNAGAQYRNDFVELFNRTNTPIDISSWSIQTATATGTTWTVIPLCGVGQTCTIGANKYYLIQLGSGGANGVLLPTADATGSTNFATTGGKVALVKNTTALTGSAAGTSPFNGATCPNTNITNVVDFVGFGNATCFEGSTAAPVLSNTTANFRAANGCTDTNSNSANLSTAAPSPRSSASAAQVCP